jgi:hypothetical protein
MNELSEHQNKVANSLAPSTILKCTYLEDLKVEQVSSIPRHLLSLLILHLVDLVVLEELFK